MSITQDDKLSEEGLGKTVFDQDHSAASLVGYNFTHRANRPGLHILHPIASVD